MNAIIWWLESPWQLRALVFILSFFVCFVGPWLHSQSVLTSRLLAKKLHDQYHGVVLAPKAEGLLQTGQEALPASEGHTQHQDAPGAVEAPHLADQGQLKAPAVQETVPAQSPVEAAVPAETASASADHPAVPAQEATAPQQVPAPAAPAPAAAAPVPQDHAPAASTEHTEETQVPAEPKAPAKQEQAGIQPSAPAAPASGFTIVNRGMRAAARRQDLAVSTGSGGSADVEVYVLSKVRDPRNAAILDSDAFAKTAAHYDAIVCAGSGPGNAAKNNARSNDGGAVELCRILARKPFIPANAKLYGLPLPGKEAAPRSLTIIGIKNVKGDLADPAIQKKLILDIINSGKIANFPAGNSAGTGPEKELPFIEVKREAATHEIRPVRTAAVKRAYAYQSKGPERNFPVVHAVIHKSGKASGNTRHFAKHDKIAVQPVAETQGSNKTHQRCGLFDFPF